MLYRSLHKPHRRDDESDSSTGSDDDERRPSQTARRAALPRSPGAPNGTCMLLTFIVVCLVAAGGTAYILLRRDSAASSGGPSSGATTTVATQPVRTVTASSAPSIMSPTTAETGNDAAATSGDNASSSRPSSAASPTSASASSESASSDAGQASLKAQGISTFLGNNTGAIASWYHTDASTDSTNGRSWCEFPYDDTVPGFAPSLATMLSSFSNDAAAAKAAFCGLAADVSSPATGTTTRLYIADAFDDKWVRTPASVDVIYGSFELLYGSTTDDKNDVVKEVSWVLTGDREDKYTYKGVGVG